MVPDAPYIDLGVKLHHTTRLLQPPPPFSATGLEEFEKVCQKGTEPEPAESLNFVQKLGWIHSIYLQLLEFFLIRC
jgi:hypothetical protein